MVKKILLAVSGAAAAGGLTVALAAAQGSTTGIKPFARWYHAQGRRDRHRIRKTFSQLRRERLIDFSEDDGEAKVVLTEAGKKQVLQYRLEEMKIEKPKRWDKKWRLVIFDIPEKLKRARNALREKLNELGFVQLQKSVWVHPYDCRNEIDFIAEVFDTAPYVRLAEADRIDGAEFLKEKFDL